MDKVTTKKDVVSNWVSFFDPQPVRKTRFSRDYLVSFFDPRSGRETKVLFRGIVQLGDIVMELLDAHSLSSLSGTNKRLQLACVTRLKHMKELVEQLFKARMEMLYWRARPDVPIGVGAGLGISRCNGSAPCLKKNMFNARHVDQIGSFCDATSLANFSRTCKCMKWIFAARLQMLLYLKDPSKRQQAIGVSIGMAIVYDKATQQPHLIKIVQEAMNKFSAISTRTKNEMGFITFKFLQNKHLTISPYERNDDYSMQVERLSGSQECSGVGSALMQAGGMEFGTLENRNFNLRLWADVSGTSPPFYWKLRMRVYRKDRNVDIARKIIRLQKNGQARAVEDLGGDIMFLPLEAAREWRLRIKQDPILYETREKRQGVGPACFIGGGETHSKLLGDLSLTPISLK